MCCVSVVDPLCVVVIDIHGPNCCLITQSFPDLNHFSIVSPNGIDSTDFEPQTQPYPQAFVTPNGIDPTYFVNTRNDPLRFIYASNPTRGLEYLLRAWPAIHQRLPGE